MFLYLETCGCIAQQAVQAADNTQQQDASQAGQQADTHGTTVLESRNRLLVWSNEHSLDYQQVVIQ